jgi:hypothetical protein
VRRNPGCERRVRGVGRLLLRHCRCASLLASLLWLPAILTAADTIQVPPGVDIQTHLTPAQAAVGDPLELDIVVTGPAGAHATISPLEGQQGDFTVLQPLPVPREPSAAGKAIIGRARYAVSVYKTGDFEFPPVTVRIQLPDGRGVEVRTPAAKVRIQSILTEKDISLRDLKKQAEIADPYRWLWWAVPMTLLAAAAAFLWWWRKRRRPGESPQVAKPDIDPIALAEEELKALIGRRLIEAGQVKAFYVSLSDISKRLLEAGYRVSTQEKTTPEILESLEACVPVPGEAANRARIGRFLEACDLVKFAKYEPSVNENDTAVGDAFDLLRLAKDRKRVLAELQHPKVPVETGPPAAA